MPINAKEPTAGVIIALLKSVGATPLIATSPTDGVITLPPTTTLGTDPIKTPAPEGLHH